MAQPSSQDYDYTAAGYDDFLSRSVDDLSQQNLDAAGPMSTSTAYDRGQVSGSIGDIFRIGNINFDGKKGRISIFDDSGNEVARIGELDD